MSPRPAPTPSLEITERALTRRELDPLVIASNWPSHTARTVYSLDSSKKSAADSPFPTFKAGILSGEALHGTVLIFLFLIYQEIQK